MVILLLVAVVLIVPVVGVLSEIGREVTRESGIFLQKVTKAAETPFGSSDRKTVFVQNLNH